MGREFAEEKKKAEKNILIYKAIGNLKSCIYQVENSCNNLKVVMQHLEKLVKRIFFFWG